MLIEIKPANAQFTKREFVNEDLIERVFLDDGYHGGIWLAQIRGTPSPDLVAHIIDKRWIAAREAELEDP